MMDYDTPATHRQYHFRRNKVKPVTGEALMQGELFILFYYYFFFFALILFVLNHEIGVLERNPP
jgi:hypothetical protein